MPVNQTERKLSEKFEQGQVQAIATFDLENSRIQLKDPEGVDMRVEDFTEAKLADYIAVLQAIAAKAATEFA